MQRESGLAALQNRDFQGAITLLEAACQLGPSDYNAHQYLAAAYQQAGRQADAINTQIAAVHLEPSNPQARYNLGVIMQRSGYTEEAGQAFQQALQLQPDYPQASDALATIRGGTPASAPPALSYPPTTNQQTPNVYDLPAGAVTAGSGPNPYAVGAPTSSRYSAPLSMPLYALPDAHNYPPAALQPAPYGANPYMAPQAGYTPSVQAVPMSPRCQACGGAGPVRTVNYNQNIGLLVMRFTKKIGGAMCDGCASKYFWQFTLTTLALGWFGIISFFASPFFIIGNVLSFARGARPGPRVLAIGILFVWLVLFVGIIALLIAGRSSGTSDSGYGAS